MMLGDQVVENHNKSDLEKHKYDTYHVTFIKAIILYLFYFHLFILKVVWKSSGANCIVWL